MSAKIGLGSTSGKQYYPLVDPKGPLSISVIIILMSKIRNVCFTLNNPVGTLAEWCDRWKASGFSCGCV